MLDPTMKMQMSAEEFREYLKDGNYGGHYQRPDEEMLELWEVAVVEARSQLEHEWE